MSFFGIGQSKLLSVDVTFATPTRTCVVKSSYTDANHVARETLPLITSGTPICCDVCEEEDERLEGKRRDDDYSLAVLFFVFLLVSTTTLMTLSLLTKLLCALKGDSIEGVLHVSPVPGKRVEHLGVKIELIGRVEAYFDRSGREGDGDFLSILREIEPPGTLSEPISKPFCFKSVDFPNESYNGKNASLRVFLKVTVVRNYASNIVNEYKLWVRNVREQPEVNNSIKMEVGIEDCLHIEFEYSKAKYHLRDAIIGKIFFLLVRVKIKRMEIEIRRREICGLGANAHGENEVIAKFEVMEGAPVRGECIPVRLFLSPYDLTPTYKSVNNKFSVKYYLNLVLIDDEDRRYFKQQEIILYRSELL